MVFEKGFMPCKLSAKVWHPMVSLNVSQRMNFNKEAVLQYDLFDYKAIEFYYNPKTKIVAFILKKEKTDKNMCFRIIDHRSGEVKIGKFLKSFNLKIEENTRYYLHREDKSNLVESDYYDSSDIEGSDLFWFDLNAGEKRIYKKDQKVLTD